MDNANYQVATGGLLVRDFLPQVVTPQPQSATPPVVEADYETFPALIDQANLWLCSHPNYSVCTCETVDLKLHNGQPRTCQSTFRARGERPNCYMRALRVWVRDLPVTIERKKPDQIGYFNVLPRWKSSDPYLGWLADVQSEPLSQLVARLNGALRVRPLEGRICSVHTFSVKFTESGILPERAVWKDRGYAKQFFLVALRVFFIKGQTFCGPISFVDLTPHARETKCNSPFVRHPKVDTFPTVLRRARSFLSQLTLPDSSGSWGLQLLNIQTLHFRQDFLQPIAIDTHSTNFCEENMHSYQLKFLRLWYTFHHAPPPPTSLPTQRSPVFHLNCKTFCPILLKKPCFFFDGKFETQPELQKRLTEWVQRCDDVKVTNVETLVMRLFSGAELFEGFSTMHTWNRVIHHSNAAHSHRHNFLHGRTHHRHGVRHCESSVAAETYVTVYRVYYFGLVGAASDFQLDDVGSKDGIKENSLEDYMLSRSTSSCCSLM